MNDLSWPPVHDQITDREREILHLLAEGASNQEIAARLFIAESTVKWYSKQIYSKLQVNSRTQAVARARLAGLLDAGSEHGRPTTPPNHLPQQLTPFIGRASELAFLLERLTDPTCRVVTLVGPGGIGKTRLALEAAQRLYFPEGAHFVALAPLSDPGLMPTVIAEAVRFTFGPGDPPKIQLFNYLQDKQMLLVLDNFEHLLAGVDLMLELLQRAPRIKLVVTSRERLQLQSETVFRLDGFPFGVWSTPEDAARSDAGRLFLQSAQRVRPGFELTSATFTDLGTICQLVDGMPLGLLLAASWVNVLSVTEIAQEIAHSFDFLEGELRDLPERQRSLRAVFMHSWSLLTEDERSAMRCVSVFRGGFSREAAQEVGAISLKTLMKLLNKSLLTRDARGRFEIHELLRQYSESELEQLPPKRERVYTRHAAYYATFMAEQWRSLKSPRAKATADLIEMEIENVRRAWVFMVNQAQFPLIARTARGLWWFLEYRAHYEVGLALFEPAVEKLRLCPRSDARDSALGDVLISLGFVYWIMGRPDEGQLRVDECLELLQGRASAEIAETVVNAYLVQSVCELLRAEYSAMKTHAQQGLEWARGINDLWYCASTALNLGVAHFHLGEYEAAYKMGQEALHYNETPKDPVIEGVCCGEVLGRAGLKLGRLEDAERYCIRGISALEAANHVRWQSQMYRYLCDVYAQMGEYENATRAYQIALRYFLKLGSVYNIIATLRSVAALFAAQGEYLKAVEMLALLINHPGAVMADVQQAQADLTRVRSKLSPEDFSAAYAHGTALNLDTLVAELLAA
ncbi:MAG: ATP-binding protein [Aggregatilineales bacterium]